MNDLEELFNRQPPYSDEDITKLITHYREARAQHLSGVKVKKPTGPKATTVDLEELGLKAPAAPEGKVKLL